MKASIAEASRAAGRDASLRRSKTPVLPTTKVRPLSGLNFQQEEYEANFRFALMRVREHSESVAVQGAEARGKVSCRKRCRPPCAIIGPCPGVIM